MNFLVWAYPPSGKLGEGVIDFLVWAYPPGKLGEGGMDFPVWAYPPSGKLEFMNFLNTRLKFNYYYYDLLFKN